MPQHAAVIAVLLLDGPTCRDCAASQSRLRATEVDRYFEIIGRTLVVLRLENERCRLCGSTGPVFCLRRSANAIDPAGPIDHLEDNDLRTKAQLLVNIHEIPSVRMRENREGKPCSLLCGRQTGRDTPWYETRFSDRSFLLDAECFVMWQQELERAKRRA